MLGSAGLFDWNALSRRLGEGVWIKVRLFYDIIRKNTDGSPVAVYEG
jgi:hypothetical protein